MMKKLMIMLAVLTMAAVANAGLVLDPPVADQSTGLNIQTDPIDAADAQQAVFLVVGGGDYILDAGRLDAGTMLYGGSLSAITDFTGVDPDLTAMVDAAIGEPSTRIDFVEFFHGTATPPAVVGVLVRYAVTYATAQGTPVVLLNPDTLEVINSATIFIPEPATFALLSLGVLCLRKRGMRS